MSGEAQQRSPRRGHVATPFVILMAIVTSVTMAPAAAFASQSAARPASTHRAGLAGSSAPAAGWQLGESGLLPIDVLDAISCPTATSCFAAGIEGSGLSAIATTTNGGTTWTVESLPPAVAQVGLAAIACADSTNCVAVGPGGYGQGAAPVIVVTTDGGVTWTSERMPGGVDSLVGVACPSAAVCWAVGSSGSAFSSGPSVLLQSTDGGATWGAVPVPAPANGLDAISCGTVTTCTAVGASGSIVTTADGGATWTAQTPPSDAPGFAGVACSSAKDCWATGGMTNASYFSIGPIAVGLSSSGGTVVATTDGGTTWTAQQLPADVASVGGISCADSTHCMAVAAAASYVSSMLLTTADGGTTWTAAAPLGSAVATSIDCPTVATCVAGGALPPLPGALQSQGLGLGSFLAVALTTVDSGAVWSTGIVPTGAMMINNTMCLDATHCWSVGAAASAAGGIQGLVEESTDGGNTWTIERPPVQSPLEGISCVDTYHCMAVGGTGFGGLVGPPVVATTSDGGNTWTVDAVPQDVAGLASVTCLTASHCIVVGATTGTAANNSPFGLAGDILSTTDGGKTWTEQPVPQVLVMYGVACPSASDCLAVGGGLGTLSFGPGLIYRSTDGGAIWTEAASTLEGLGLYAISCPTVATCIAVGGSGGRRGTGIIDTSTDGGTTWNMNLDLSTQGVETLTHVSCATARACWATTGAPFADIYASGDVLATVDGGASWSAQPLPVVAVETLGIACPVGGKCIASGATATRWFVISSGNGGWAPPSVTAISPSSGYADGGTAVAVTGAGFATGATSVDFGGAPSPTVEVTSLDSLVAISPPGTGTVAVTVATPGGTSSAGAAEQFSYVPTTPFTPGSPAAYQPLVPYRVADTRWGSGEPDAGQALLGNGVLSVPVAGTEPPGQSSGGVPADATAVVLNVTAVPSLFSQARGYLTVWPAGAPRPLASNVNFAPLTTVANLVTAPLGAGGAVNVFASEGPTDVVVDVEGFFAPKAADRFTPLFPARIADTRPGSGQPDAGSTLGAVGVLAVQVAGAGGVPASGADAVVLDVTGVNAASGGYLTVFPAGSALPVASNVNFAAGRAVTNTVAVPLGNAGSVSVYASRAQTNVVIDVLGYFGPAGAGELTAITPVRAADTRPGSGEPDAGKTLAGGSTISVQVDGVGNVPAAGSAGAPTAVVLDVAVVGGTARGFLTAWPTGAAMPLASALNWVPGEIVAALVIVPVGKDGKVSFYDSAGSANVIVDVEGWFA